MLQNQKLYIKMILWKYRMNKIMNSIGQNARKAILNKIDTRTKNKILKRYALLLDKEKNSIISANQKDIKFAKKKA